MLFASFNGIAPPCPTLMYRWGTPKVHTQTPAAGTIAYTSTTVTVYMLASCTLPTFKLGT
jgi:hypothetical protein